MKQKSFELFKLFKMKFGIYLYFVFAICDLHFMLCPAVMDDVSFKDNFWLRQHTAL